jgi:hypothetical protein
VWYKGTIMATQLASPQYEFKEHEAKKKAKLQKGHVHLQLDIGQSFAVQLLRKRWIGNPEVGATLNLPCSRSPKRPLSLSPMHSPSHEPAL